MRRAALFAGLFGGLALAQGAAAHAPYLKPSSFAPHHPFVTVEAALTEGSYFVPDIPIRGDGGYWVTGGAGPAVKVEAAATLKELVIVEAPLPADGTYRISTGERPGRSGKWAKIDGVWKMVRPAGAPGGPGGGPGGGRAIEESAVPAGAETMVSQSFLRADTYVTKGAPTRGALRPTGQGVEVEPVTHPNEVFAGEAFKFNLLNDGKPLAGVAFNIARAGDLYAEKRFGYSSKTDANGTASVTLTQPGAYVLEVNYPARAEGATEPMPRSTVYSLTFEVTR